MSFGFGLGLPRASTNGGGAALNLNFAGMAALPSSIVVTRATNATYTDSTGTMTYAPNNLAQQSQTFNTAPWLPQFATAVENSDIAPDGTRTATRWTATSNVNQSWNQQALTNIAAGTYIVSVYAKAVNNAVGKSFGPWLWASGTATLVGGGNGLPTSWSTLTSDWVRYSRVVSVATPGTINLRFDFGYTSSPTVGDAISVWGYQCEQVTYQTSPSTYVPTTTNQYFGPRIDYNPDPNNFVQQNLWTYSGIDQATNPGSVGNGTAVYNTTDTAAPNGTYTALKITENTLNGSHFYTLNAVPWQNYVQYSVSFYVKGNGTCPAISLGGLGLNGQTYYFYFNLATGAFTAAPPGSTAVSVGNGWWYLTFSIITSSYSNFTVNMNQVYGGSPTYTGNGTNSIYLWGFQLNEGPPLQFLPVGATTQTVPSAMGLLCETISTNQCFYSQDFSNAAWAKTNATVYAPSTTAPDGTLTGNAITVTATAATNVLFAAPVAATSTTYTYSVYLRASTSATTGNAVLLRNSTTATNLLGVTVNLTTGVITYTNGTSGAVAQRVGRGWWRISLTVSSGITVGDGLLGYIGWTGGTGTAGDSVYAWGAQLEPNAYGFASSYIYTTNSTVTRGADAYGVSTGLFGASGNAVGTYISTSDTSAQFGTRAVAQNGAATANFSYIHPLGYGGAYDTVNIALTTNTATQYIPFNIATTYNASGNSLRVCLSGGAIGSSAYNGNFSGYGQVQLGGYGSLNGHVKTFQYYPYVLTDAQIQTITYAQYLLLESGNRFLLENSSGALMLG